MSEQLRTEYNPDVVTPPAETLQDILDAWQMTKAELAQRIGKTPKTIGEIINHNAPITPDTAVALEKALGTPASFWDNRERRYRGSLARIAERERLKNEVNWLKIMPVRAMINAGWIKEFKDKVDQVNAVRLAVVDQVCVRQRSEPRRPFPGNQRLVRRGSAKGNFRHSKSTASRLIGRTFWRCLTIFAH